MPRVLFSYLSLSSHLHDQVLTTYFVSLHHTFLFIRPCGSICKYRFDCHMPRRWRLMRIDTACESFCRNKSVSWLCTRSSSKDHDLKREDRSMSPQNEHRKCVRGSDFDSSNWYQSIFRYTNTHKLNPRSTDALPPYHWYCPSSDNAVL